MKIVKLIGFLLLLSSCNKYFGKIDPDYIPKNEIEDVFSNKTIIIEKNNKFNIGEVIYPSHKKFNYKKTLNLKEITNIDENSKILILENEIFYNKKNILFSFNKEDLKEKKISKIQLDKDEEIILISNIDNYLFILSNKGKVFKLIENSFEKTIDMQVFLNQNTIVNDLKIIAFSVFGEIIEIDLKNNIYSISGEFIINHGISTSSSNYTFKNNHVILYNSGTLIFLDKFNNSPELNYYLEDLNILSQVGTYEEFIDAPFNINNFLYFIEKKGLISVFNPITSEILWETDLSSSIIDYFIDEYFNLYILSFNKIFIFSSQGYLQKEIAHSQENPINFWTDGENLYLANQDGINVINFNGELINSIKQKFTDFLKFYKINNQYYFVDSRNLYTLSE